MPMTNRWGEPCNIISDLGQHQPKGFRAPVTLVMIEYPESGETGYQFAELGLRADGGLNFIMACVAAAEKRTLTGPKLKAALKAAE